MAVMLTATNLATYALVAYPGQTKAQSLQTQTCAPNSSIQPRRAVTAEPGLHTDLESKTYRIQGSTINELRDQMAACTPVKDSGRPYAASTNYSLAWSYSYQPRNDGLCAINNASVSINVLQVYPAWQTPSTTNHWNDFMTHLKTHENGHARLDFEAASDIVNILNDFPGTDCDVIEANANQAAHDRLETLDQANQNYDNQTNHGATQGAIL